MDVMDSGTLNFFEKVIIDRKVKMMGYFLMTNIGLFFKKNFFD